MAKKARRRGTTGMLTSMVKYPKGSQHRKEQSVFRRIAYWAGTVAIGAALLAMLAVLLTTLFNPEAGKREAEGDFSVDRIVEDPPGYAPSQKVVAEAFVEIERSWARIPLTEKNREGVEKGTVLHIRYEWVPRMGVARIREWSLGNREAGGPSGAGEPPAPPP